MDNLRCIVVDDEPLAVKMIENFIERTPFLSLEASFNDPVLALSEIKSRRPHLVFLDIQMPDLSGMELSRMIPEGTRIIFTTAFKQYAFDSYEVSAIDFLMKPIRYQKFLEAAEKAREWFTLKEAAALAGGSQADEGQGGGAVQGRSVVAGDDAKAAPPSSVFIKADGSLRKVELSDILYITGMKDYVMVQLASERNPLVTHITMKAVEDMLPAAMFMRVHRSYIVALDRISSVSPSLDIVVSGKLIHVGDQYRDQFSRWLSANSLTR